LSLIVFYSYLLIFSSVFACLGALHSILLRLVLAFVTQLFKGVAQKFLKNKNKRTRRKKP